MAAPPRIQESVDDGVPVVRFLDRKILAEPAVRESAEQVMATLPRGAVAIRMIVDFSGVELVASALLGKLIQLQRRVDASGGRLVLCNLNPMIRDVLRTTNLETLFRIARDRREAREAFEGREP